MKHKSVDGSMRWISRVDQAKKHSHGFYVRVHGRSKFFSDRKRGGRVEALRLAKEWRDEQAALLGLEVEPQLTVPQSGVVGVVYVLNVKKDRWYAYWRATWSEQGCIRRKSFSILKLGDRRALQLAKQYRAERSRDTTVTTKSGQMTPKPQKEALSEYNLPVKRAQQVQWH